MNLVQPFRTRYALISMPWFWAQLPSIQLAIVKQELSKQNVSADVFEFYTDILSDVGIELYKALANDSGFSGELVFSQFYFEDHEQQWRFDRPELGLGVKDLEDDLFRFISPIAEAFIDRCFEQVSWQDYSTVCFSLTANQTAASMLMAKRIRAKFPGIKIIFGGTSCAGDMGLSIARICNEVDVVVRSEAEVVISALVAALDGQISLSEVPGIIWRSGDALYDNGSARQHDMKSAREPLNFDAYFERVKRNGAAKLVDIWLPFESSRGCWYGEKVQCTFCGLDEVIRYRERDNSHLTDELQHYSEKYGLKRFFALDLIMPRSFFNGFLKDVEERGKDWSIFYEIKSNLKRRDIEQMARGGIKWTQPGIESLDDRILKIMRKGVSAAQNIQTLKWSKELGILPSWNFLMGFPHEPASSYWDMAALVPKLYHLDPPSGLGEFEVHRFSPYSDNPAAYSIEVLGAHDSYKVVYPVEATTLNSLVYRHKHRLLGGTDPELADAHEALRSAVNGWRIASARGASLSLSLAPNGAITVQDTRGSEHVSVYEIFGAEAVLFCFLGDMKQSVLLKSEFEKLHHAEFVELGGADGISGVLKRWIEAALIIEVSGMTLALPVKAQSGSRTQMEGDKEWSNSLEKSLQPIS